jgi:hypothetical protein
VVLYVVLYAKPSRPTSLLVMFEAQLPEQLRESKGFLGISLGVDTWTSWECAYIHKTWFLSMSGRTFFTRRSCGVIFICDLGAGNIVNGTARTEIGADRARGCRGIW